MNNFLSRETTTELKALAFFMVFFAHIGYFLFPVISVATPAVAGMQFTQLSPSLLQPISDYAGVGVDMFLFLSGFGLCLGVANYSVIQFYKKRLKSIYVPLILSTVLIVTIDALFGRDTSFFHVLPALTGILPTADLYKDFNSPLWFITFLLIFYVITPLVVKKDRPIRSAVFIVVFGFVLSYVLKFLVIHTTLQFPIQLYLLHTLAFPLGVVCGLFYDRLNVATGYILKTSLHASLVFITTISFIIYIYNHSFVDTISEQYQSLVLVVLFILFYSSFKTLLNTATTYYIQRNLCLSCSQFYWHLFI